MPGSCPASGSSVYGVYTGNVSFAGSVETVAGAGNEEADDDGEDSSSKLRFHVSRCKARRFGVS